MIDSITGKRVVVLMDKDLGPYIRISYWGDGSDLEDFLSDVYGIIYEKQDVDDLNEHAGSEYYFGNAADPEKLQCILDEIQI
jgi:hypothetical protein